VTITVTIAFTVTDISGAATVTVTAAANTGSSCFMNRPARDRERGFVHRFG